MCVYVIFASLHIAIPMIIGKGLQGQIQVLQYRGWACVKIFGHAHHPPCICLWFGYRFYIPFLTWYSGNDDPLDTKPQNEQKVHYTEIPKDVIHSASQDSQEMRGDTSTDHGNIVLSELNDITCRRHTTIFPNVYYFISL